MKNATGFRVWKAFVCGGAVLVMMASQPCITLFAQSQVAQIELSPPDAIDTDVVSFKLSGTWPNGCVPQSPMVSISTGSVRIDTTNPGMVCTQALTPWTLNGTIGKLSAGQYDVIARFS